MKSERGKGIEMKETMYGQEIEAFKHMTDDEIRKMAIEVVEKAERKGAYKPHGGAGKKSHHHPTTDPSKPSWMSGVQHKHPQGVHGKVVS